MQSVITKEQLDRALALRDLSDPAAGAHALQLVADAIRAGLERAWGCPVHVHRSNAIVTISENYEVLGYPADAPAREARYTRYLDGGRLLRTHMTAAVPGALRNHARNGRADLVVACPGLVYRRDVVDRLHVGEPHQLDLWRVRRGAPLAAADLDEMVAAVVSAVLPGARHRTLPATHPYTTEGREVEVEVDGHWVELLECGLAGRARPARGRARPGASGRGSPSASASTARSCSARELTTSASCARPIRASRARCSTSSPTGR